MSRIYDIFKADGDLSQLIPGYIPRDEQIKLALAIDDNLREHRHLIADATTGTGKSMAYGVPAALWAKEYNLRVIIVTANIALQDQLVKKDLPIIKTMMDGNLEFNVLKGRSNYLCLLRYKAELNKKPSDRLPILNRVQEWADETKTGDKHEITDFDITSEEWRKLSSTSEECIGRECDFYNQCHSYNAKRRCEQSHIIVVNYHLLFSDFVVRQATDGDFCILPPSDAIIMDEAHEAADIGRAFLGWSLSEVSLRKPVMRFQKSIGKSDERNKLVDDTIGAIDNMAMWLRAAMEHQDGISKAGRIIRKLPDLFNIISVYEQLHKSMEERGHEIIGYGSKEDQEEGEELLEYAGQCLAIAAKLKIIFGDQPFPNEYLYFIEDRKMGKSQTLTMSIEARVMQIQDFMHNNIFDKMTAVMTSATLAVDGNFDFMSQEELGVKEYQSLVLDSPFDPKRVMAVIPNDCPEPTGNTRDAHKDAVAKTAYQVISQLGGRTMVLFTSDQGMRHAANYLYNNVRGVKVLVQGQGRSNHALIEEFKATEHAALLGLASFWQGVDIPGRQLSCVIIDKIPFASLDAMSEWFDLFYSAQGDRAFFKRSIPQAVIAMKQGIGRLIRRIDDYGSIIIMDPRIVNKGYGGSFRQVLKDYHHSRNVQDAIDFIKKMDGDSDA